MLAGAHSEHALTMHQSLATVSPLHRSLIDYLFAACIHCFSVFVALQNRMTVYSLDEHHPDTKQKAFQSCM